MTSPPLFVEAALATWQFWGLVVGIPTIVVVIGWWLTSRTRTLFDVWWALRPLLIPLVGIALVATLAELWLRGLAFLATLGLLVWLLVHQWKDDSGSSRGIAVVRGALSWPLVVVAVLMVAPFVLFRVREGDPSLVGAYDFYSRFMVAVGFGLWALVVLLRLRALAVTIARAFVAIVFLAAYVRYYLGLFVAGDIELSVADHIVWGALVVAGLVWLVAFENRSGRPGADQSAARTHGWGMTAALFSALAFLLAGATALFTEPPIEQTDSPFVEKDVAGSGELERPDVEAMIDSPDNRRLVRHFSPLLQFTDAQRWRPIAVKDYLADADLRFRRKVSKPAPLKRGDLKKRCSPPDPKLCYELTIRCPIKRADKTACEGATDPQEGYKRDGTAYVRVIEDPKLLGYGPYREELELVVQYWLFYYYDDWRADTLFGELRQAHEADWEVISVGFSERSPLFVALSAHCGGTWLPWDRMRVAQFRDQPYHPIVGVAEGSQANYHEPRDNIPPDNWARCAGIPSNTVSALSIGYKIRDRTGVHGSLRLRHLPLVKKDDAVMTFPGLWGTHGVAHFYTAFGRRYELEKPHVGPASPGHQATWSKPLKTIFCGARGTWRRVAGPKVRKEDCEPPGTA